MVSVSPSRGPLIRTSSSACYADQHCRRRYTNSAKTARASVRASGCRAGHASVGAAAVRSFTTVPQTCPSRRRQGRKFQVGRRRSWRGGRTRCSGRRRSCSSAPPSCRTPPSSCRQARSYRCSQKAGHIRFVRSKPPAPRQSARGRAPRARTTARGRAVPRSSVLSSARTTALAGSACVHTHCVAQLPLPPTAPVPAPRRRQRRARFL